MIKVVAPRMGQAVVDAAIQVHGGMGVSDDTILARAFAMMRSLRLADGPDEVHIRWVAEGRLEEEEDEGLRGGRGGAWWGGQDGGGL